MSGEVENRPQPYDRMAAYYDAVYRRIVDYEADCDLVEKVLRIHCEHQTKSILDLGCGTGNHACILASRGYSITGVDVSETMIKAARAKVPENTGNPVFYKMDMRTLNLNNTYDAALVLFGGFGYLLKEEDIRNFLSSLAKHVPQGILIFEFWQVTAVRSEATSPEGYMTWGRIEDGNTGRTIIRLDRSNYDSQTSLQAENLEFYVLDSKKREVVDVFSETHITRLFSVPEIRHILTENGFQPIAFYVGDRNTQTLSAPTAYNFRVMCVAEPQEK